MFDEATATECEADELEAVLRGPVLAPLDDLGVISVNGADAASFLQAQLTNDSAAASGGVIRNGYCTPKGRLLAVFDHWASASGEAHRLQLPREILAAVLKRLSMFVLRSKARLSDDTGAWRTWAVFGPGAAAWLARASLPVPEPQSSIAHGDVVVWRQPDGTRCAERFMVLAPREKTFAADGVRAVSSAAWWWSQIDAGIPQVWAATQERFVPQMINLEVLNGVNFRKGCYPGQEVVARSQYLGKLRRRMHLAHASASTFPGADVWAAGQPQPVGTVVMCAAAPGGGFDLLFECPQDAVASDLQLARDGHAIHVRPLPYALVDVTA